MDKIIEYYDKFSEVLAEAYKVPNPRHQAIRRVLNKLILPGMNVLDLGCGIGTLSKIALQLGADNVLGVDISPKMIEKAIELNPGIVFVSASITEYVPPFTPDVIILSDILEHIPYANLDKLYETILKYTYKRNPYLKIFVNIPYYPIQQFLHSEHPDKQQIVDENYSTASLLEDFNRIYFIPERIDIYGVDVDCQYVNIIFKTKESFYETYRKVFQ